MCPSPTVSPKLHKTYSNVDLATHNMPLETLHKKQTSKSRHLETDRQSIQSRNLSISSINQISAINVNMSNMKFANTYINSFDKVLMEAAKKKEVCNLHTSDRQSEAYITQLVQKIYPKRKQAAIYHVKEEEKLISIKEGGFSGLKRSYSQRKDYRKIKKYVKHSVSEFYSLISALALCKSLGNTQYGMTNAQYKIILKGMEKISAKICKIKIKNPTIYEAVIGKIASKLVSKMKIKSYSKRSEIFFHYSYDNYYISLVHKKLIALSQKLNRSDCKQDNLYKESIDVLHETINQLNMYLTHKAILGASNKARGNIRIDNKKIEDFIERASNTYTKDYIAKDFMEDLEYSKFLLHYHDKTNMVETIDTRNEILGANIDKRKNYTGAIISSIGEKIKLEIEKCNAARSTKINVNNQSMNDASLSAAITLTYLVNSYAFNRYKLLSSACSRDQKINQDMLKFLFEQDPANNKYSYDLYFKKGNVFVVMNKTTSLHRLELKENAAFYNKKHELINLPFRELNLMIDKSKYNSKLIFSVPISSLVKKSLYGIKCIDAFTDYKLKTTDEHFIAANNITDIFLENTSKDNDLNFLFNSKISVTKLSQADAESNNGLSDIETISTQSLDSTKPTKILIHKKQDSQGSMRTIQSTSREAEEIDQILISQEIRDHETDSDSQSKDRTKNTELSLEKIDKVTTQESTTDPEEQTGSIAQNEIIEQSIINNKKLPENQARETGSIGTITQLAEKITEDQTPKQTESEKLPEQSKQLDKDKEENVKLELEQKNIKLIDKSLQETSAILGQNKQSQELFSSLKTEENKDLLREELEKIEIQNIKLIREEVPVKQDIQSEKDKVIIQPAQENAERSVQKAEEKEPKEQIIQLEKKDIFAQTSQIINSKEIAKPVPAKRTAKTEQFNSKIIHSDGQVRTSELLKHALEKTQQSSKQSVQTEQITTKENHKDLFKQTEKTKDYIQRRKSQIKAAKSGNELMYGVDLKNYKINDITTDDCASSSESSQYEVKKQRQFILKQDLRSSDFKQHPKLIHKTKNLHHDHLTECSHQEKHQTDQSYICSSGCPGRYHAYHYTSEKPVAKFNLGHKVVITEHDNHVTKPCHMSPHKLEHTKSKKSYDSLDDTECMKSEIKHARRRCRNIDRSDKETCSSQLVEELLQGNITKTSDKITSTKLHQNVSIAGYNETIIYQDGKQYVIDPNNPNIKRILLTKKHYTNKHPVANVNLQENVDTYDTHKVHYIGASSNYKRSESLSKSDEQLHSCPSKYNQPTNKKGGHFRCLGTRIVNNNNQVADIDLKQITKISKAHDLTSFVGSCQVDSNKPSVSQKSESRTTSSGDESDISSYYESKKDKS